MSEIPNGELAAALALAISSAGAVEKDAANTFHRYRYASAEAVIAEARGALAAHGLALVPTASGVDWVGGDSPPHGWLARTWTLVHAGGGSMPLQQRWPIVVERGRPPDKAVAAADTAGLAYMLRDLLLLPRVEEGTGLDDDSRDRPQERPRARQKPQERSQPRAEPEAPPAAPGQQEGSHHASWARDRAHFCGAVSDLGFKPEDVFDFVQQTGRSGLRPSGMDQTLRTQTLAYIETAKGQAAVREWLVRQAETVDDLHKEGVL